MHWNTKKIYNAVTGKGVKSERNDNSAAVVAWLADDLEAQTLIGLNCNSPMVLKSSKCTSASAMLGKLDKLHGKRSDIFIKGI